MKIKIVGSDEMKISSNITAMMTIASLNKANNSAGAAMQRLSSGLKINSAKDNPAGLAIANKLDIQVQGLSQANDNAMDGISLIQTAEGALNEVHAMLNRIKEISVQGVNGTLTDDDREKSQLEIDALVGEIKKIGEETEFNKINVLNTDENIMIQVGANANQSILISGQDINLNQTNDIIKDLNLKDQDILSKIDEAIAMTSKIRGTLGSHQNRLEHTVANLGVSEENMTSSLSRIQDADMAEEMTKYTQYNVISQSGIAMLAQANQRPQQVLQLLNA